MKNEIRPIYSELQGYLSQISKSNESYETIRDPSVWKNLNSSIDELSELASADYSKFKIEPQKGQFNSLFVTLTEYRNKVGGLVAKIHGKFFSDEPTPFTNMPSTVISQQQSQTQSVDIKVILNLSEKINKEIGNYEEGTPERTFLEKVKEKLDEVKNNMDLIKIILEAGVFSGLAIKKIISLLF